MNGVNNLFFKGKYLIVVLCLSVVLFFIFFKIIFIQKIYIKLFGKNQSIAEYNEGGEVHGEFLNYQNGRLTLRSHYQNGLMHGKTTYYYDNGRVEGIKSFTEDNPNGEELKYYRNGNLKYSANWKNGKPYGSFYWYLESGKLDSYTVYDIVGQNFYICQYNTKGELLNNDGFIVSLNIYSTDISTDSIAILKYNEHYENIKDLYITVATPPELKPKLVIKINNIVVEKFKIVENTIKIPNAFDKTGIYEVNIQSKFVNKDDIAVDSLISGMTFYKD